MSTSREIAAERLALRAFLVEAGATDLAALLDGLSLGPGCGEAAIAIQTRAARSRDAAPSEGYRRLARLVATFAGVYVRRAEMFAALTAARKGRRELRRELRGEGGV